MTTVDFLAFDLNTLKSEDPKKAPQWGSMNLHQMVEHLLITLEISGKNTHPPAGYEHEKFEKGRAFVLSDKPMPRNYEAKYFPKIEETRFKTLNESLQALEKERKSFWQSFEADPDKTIYHPNFGRLDKHLVHALQNKHFTHHFQQFNLV